MRKRGPLFVFCVPREREDGSAYGAARIKGIFSFSKENIPLEPQEKGYIASLDLEELHALRNVSAVYMASP